MSYQSQREKVREYFLTKIFPAMTEQGIDYIKTVSIISCETGATPSVVDDVIRTLIASEKIKESRFLDLSEIEVQERRKRKAELIQKELTEAGLN